MPRYSYIAKTFSGEPRSGILEAKDEHELAGVLHREGYIVISVSLAGKKEKKRLSLSIPFFGGVSLVDKLMFTRNLKVMVSAGVSLPRALKLLALQAKSKKFKKAISVISEEIIRGKSFSDSLAKHPKIFSELFCNMVKVGEESGTMEDVLVVLANQMEREHELFSRVKGALVYPAVILTVMVVIGIVMMIVIVPKLAQTFTELNIELPLTTRAVIATSKFLERFWYLIPLLVAALFFSFRYIIRTKTGKKVSDKFILKMPIISSIVKKTNSAYTSRTLSSLIVAGVPIVRALEIISRTLGNVYYKQALANAAEQVKKGSKLAEALSGYEEIYSPLLIQMVEIGEETGETSSILGKLADFFESEVTEITKNLSSVIEPFLMIIVGAVVGFFVISMMQPMYSMLSGME